MGQNSSKRRQRASGKSKTGNSDAGSHGAREDINGSIEVSPDQDVGNAAGSRHKTPTSPTSVTSASPPKTPEKKEKRKRFRVGFSLKRTPSGRWSRKKKNATQNGTRPVSSTDSLKGEHILNPGRPQSLFLDEVQVDEEDNKIETVDLSDNDDGNPLSTDGNKTAPKVPEKTKWRRGSNKKSSGKKKKKDKETSKKDKKKKQKNAEVLTNTTKVTDVGSEVCTTLAEPNEKRREPMDTSDSVENGKSPDLRQPEVDIDKIASAIVSQTVKAAQERLRAEAYNGSTDTRLTSDKQELVNAEVNTMNDASFVSGRSEVELEDARVEDHEDMAMSKLETQSSASRIAEDIIAEIMDKSAGGACEQAVEKDSPLDLQSCELEVENTENDDVVKESSVEEDTKIEQCKQSQESPFLQNEAEDSLTLKSHIIKESLSSTVDTDNGNLGRKKDIDMEEYVSEMIAKKTVENVIAAALQVVRKEDLNKSNKHSVTNQTKDNSVEILSQPKNSTDDCTDGDENDNQENPETNQQNTVLEVVNEVTCKQVEEKVQDKNDKHKSKSEIKMKVQKKLSHWFHKKDKQPKSVNETENPSSSTKESSLAGEALVVSKNNQNVNQKEMLEMNEFKIESLDSNLPPNSANASLTFEASMKPLLVAPTTPSESSPDSNDVTSPTASISPISFTSDTSELESQCSAGEKKVESGVLKKISIGSRLRTAILRKKSSEGSEDVQEVEKCLLTPPKHVDSNALTPPPRKSRNKKLEQSSPGASDSHTVLVSEGTTLQPPHEATDSALIYHLSGVENSIITEDSGFTDLTSPESNKSDICFSEPAIVLESEHRNVDETAAFIDFARENSEETAAVLDSVHHNSEETADVLDYVHDNSEKTVVVLVSEQGNVDNTAALLDFSRENSEETVTVFDFTRENSVDTAAVRDSLHDESKETAGVHEFLYANSEETATFHNSLLASSEETAAVLESTHDHPRAVLGPEGTCSEETTSVFYSSHEYSEETKIVLDSTHWNSEETVVLLDSGNSTSDKTIADVNSMNSVCLTHLTDGHNNNNDNSQHDNNRVAPDDDDDDTRPLPTDYPGAIVCSESVDYFAPIEPAKLISTAVIILRSPSSSGHTDIINRVSTVRVSSTSRTQPANESSLPVTEMTNEQSRSLISTPNLCSYELRKSSCSFDTFEGRNEHNEDRPKNREQKKLFYDVPTTAKPNELPSVMDDDGERRVEDCAFIESDTFIQKDESFVRTITEYKIGKPSEYEDFIYEKLITECPVGGETGQDSFTHVADITEGATEFQCNHAEAQSSPESFGSMTVDGKRPCPILSDDSVVANRHILQHNRHEHSNGTEIDQKLQMYSCPKEEHGGDIRNASDTFVNGNYVTSAYESFGFSEATSGAGDCLKDVNFNGTSDSADTTNETELVILRSENSIVQECSVSNVVNPSRVALAKFHNGDIGEDKLN